MKANSLLFSVIFILFSVVPTTLLAKNPNITQVLIDHDLRFVLDLADRVTVLDFGRRVAEGTPAQIQEHPEVLVAYAGETAAREEP